MATPQSHNNTHMCSQQDNVSHKFEPNRTPLYLSLLSSSSGAHSLDTSEPLIWKELTASTVQVPIDQFIMSFLPDLSIFRESLPEALDNNQSIQRSLAALNSATLEEELYGPLETLINDIITMVYSRRSDGEGRLEIEYLALGNTPVGGSTRKPNGVLVEPSVAQQYRSRVANKEVPSDETAPKSSSLLPWGKVLVSFEVKLARSGVAGEHVAPDSPARSRSGQHSSSSRSKASEPGKRTSTEDNIDNSQYPKRQNFDQKDVRLAGYLAEMRSALGNRTHTFGCSIHGSYFDFWFADPLGVIRSIPLNLSQHLTEFATVIIGFATCGAEDLGYDKCFVPPQEYGSVIPFNLTNWEYSIDPQHNVTILEVRKVRWGLTGRCTAVYIVDWKGEVAVLKVSRPFAVRTREAELLRKARDYVEDRVTRVFYDASKGNVSSGFRSKLAAGSVELRFDRSIEVVVLELLWELNSVRHIEDYTDAFIQIIQALFTLYEKGRILHRDISSRNLMIRPDSKHKPQGVINDFDLAVDLTAIPEHDHTLLHRVGTLPFLAVDLLLPNSPPGHIFRFDLESALYVYLWDAVYFKHGKPAKHLHKSTFIKDWASADPGRNLMTRTSLGMFIQNDPSFLNDRQPFASHICRLLYSLRSGESALMRARLDGLQVQDQDRETMFGHFTFRRMLDTFEAIQNQYGGPQSLPRKCQDAGSSEGASTEQAIASMFHKNAKGACSPIFTTSGESSGVQ